MTLYLLFAGLGILIYTGVALAEAAVSGVTGAPVAFGLPVEASIILPNGSQAAVAGSESAGALASGTTLFQERGCDESYLSESFH